MNMSEFDKPFLEKTRKQTCIWKIIPLSESETKISFQVLIVSQLTLFESNLIWRIHHLFILCLARVLSQLNLNLKDSINLIHYNSELGEII